MKTKIVLDGEAEYNSAIKKAQSELKRLRTELKAESAELKANGKENETAAKKQESLRKQIAEQEKVVATLKKALAEAKESYSDNADVVAKWENKLNEARATLANMQTDLKGLGESFKEADNGAAMGTVATKSFADALGDISNVGQTLSDGIESIFTSMVDTISGAISKLFDEVMALADKANQWTDIAGFWGTSTSEIEKWSHAVEGSHNGFDQLTGAIRKFALGGKADTITEVLGISKGENQSDWEYGIACLREMYRLTHDEGQNLDGLYEKVFGERRAEGVMDIVNDWATIEDNLKVFDVENGGVGMTEAQMSDMATLAEQVSLIEEKWSAFKDSFIAGAVGKLGLELSDDANGILDHFIAFMDTKDQSELDAMVADVKKFFEDLSTGISAGIASINEVGQALMESDDPTTQAIGKIVTGIADALEWLANSDNWSKIEDCLRAFFDLWLVGKGAEALGAIAQLAANIKVIGGFGGGLNLLGGGGGTAATGLSGLMGGGTLTTIASSCAFLLPISILIKGISEMVSDHYRAEEWYAAELKRYNDGKDNGYDQVEQVGQYWDEFANGVLTPESGVSDFNRMYEGWNKMKAGEDDGWFSNLYTGVSQEMRDKMDELFGDFMEMSLWQDSMAYNTQKQDFVDEVLADLEAQILASQMTGSYMTQEQEQAMQDWWDIYRTGASDETQDEYFNKMAEAFGGEDSPLFSAIYDLIETFEAEQNGYDSNDAFNITDLPALWFNQQLSGMGITNTQAQTLDSTLRGLPGAVARGVSSLRVDMNGTTVGRIVAPYVSELIAADID